MGEAVQKGLERRRQAGHDTSRMGPVCTIMVGRLDDWLKDVANKQDIVCDPEILDWAGVAAMKQAYGIYRERGYTCRLLAAATRHHRHWSAFIGGDVVVTLTHKWQKRFNGSDIDVVPRMDEPVDGAILDQLSAKFTDFRRAYEPDGMSHAEFDAFGATKKTLSSFAAGYHDLVKLIRNYMLPV